jgi:hypothetical protein
VKLMASASTRVGARRMPTQNAGYGIGWRAMGIVVLCAALLGARDPRLPQPNGGCGPGRPERDASWLIRRRLQCHLVCALRLDLCLPLRTAGSGRRLGMPGPASTIGARRPRPFHPGTNCESPAAPRSPGGWEELTDEQPRSGAGAADVVGRGGPAARKLDTGRLSHESRLWRPHFWFVVHAVCMGFNLITGDLAQSYLLPPDVRDWLPEDHLAWFVLEVVDEVDLSGFYAQRRLDGRGGAAYDPAILLAVLVHAYCVGERSSRRIERRLHEDVARRRGSIPTTLERGPIETTNAAPGACRPPGCATSGVRSALGCTESWMVGSRRPLSYYFPLLFRHQPTMLASMEDAVVRTGAAVGAVALAGWTALRFRVGGSTTFCGEAFVARQRDGTTVSPVTRCRGHHREDLTPRRAENGELSPAGVPAVHHQVDAGHEGRRVTGQEQQGAGHLVDGPEPLHRRTACAVVHDGLRDPPVDP